VVFSTPAGAGTAADPTPPGQYFVAFTELVPESDPGCGAFIIVTSDHSKTIGDWEGSGDAVIGIHGHLGSDQETGTTGTRLSHGSVLHRDAVQVCHGCHQCRGAGGVTLVQHGRAVHRAHHRQVFQRHLRRAIGADLDAGV
jgi:hypothetical protein